MTSSRWVFNFLARSSGYSLESVECRVEWPFSGHLGHFEPPLGCLTWIALTEICNFEPGPTRQKSPFPVNSIYGVYKHKICDVYPYCSAVTMTNANISYLFTRLMKSWKLWHYNYLSSTLFIKKDSKAFKSVEIKICTMKINKISILIR